MTKTGIRQFKPNELYEIVYVNFSGIVSTRVIRYLGYEKHNGIIYIIAFCFLRNEQRTFRYDRILASQHLENDEEYSVQRHAATNAAARPPVFRPSTVVSGYSADYFSDTNRTTKAETRTPAAKVELETKQTFGTSASTANTTAAARLPVFRPSTVVSGYSADYFSDTNRTTKAETRTPAAKVELETKQAFATTVSTANTTAAARPPVFTPSTTVSGYGDDFFDTDTSDDVSKYLTKRRISLELKMLLALIAAFLIFANVYKKYTEDSNTSGQTQQTQQVQKTQPVQPVTPTVTTVVLGGKKLIIHTNQNGEWYEVPYYNYTTTNKKDAIRLIRASNFKSYTGLSDPLLIQRYLDADLDSNGKLSYRELEIFQSKMRQYVMYKHNETALRPDVFLAQGGGDCEDFALYTAGLLRFYGWQPYVVCFSKPGENSGHAVCFSYEGDGTGVPSSYYCYDVRNMKTFYGEPVPDGKYICIDFEYVGKHSFFEKEGGVLDCFFIPETIYGIRI